MSNKVTQKGYEGYIKAYDDKLESFKRRKLPIDNVSAKLTFRQYQAVYTGTKNDLLDEVKRGERKSVGNVAQRIISNQFYSVSIKQAKALMIANQQIVADYNAEVDERGGKRSEYMQPLTMAQIRAGMFDDTAITDYRKRKAAEGLPLWEINHLVSQYFFGSN